MNSKPNTQIEWLKVLLAAVLLAALIISFLALPNPKTPPTACVELARNVIPGMIVILIVFIALYFAFVQKEIPTGTSTGLNVEEVADAVAARMSRARTDVDVGLLEFHESYRGIDWKRLLLDAREHVDIVVYYYDSWVNANFNELTAFFQRPKTTMTIFVGDPNVPAVLDSAHRLFPEYSKEALREKILNTGVRIKDAAQNAGAATDRVKFLLVPFPISYSAQLIDRTRLNLGLFEMNRRQKIDSPAFLIDVGKNRHLNDFIRKELELLNEVAKQG